MPVWHAKTKALVASGELAVIGIVQEQHPDRTALYAQWQEFEFPILWDPFGLTGLEVVPVVSAIDQHGIIRLPRPDPRRFDEQFMAEFMAEPFAVPAASKPGGRAAPAEGFHFGAAEDPVQRALSHLLLGGPNTATIDEDVAALVARAAETGAPVDRFRAGVALRMRSDGPRSRAGDFQSAVYAWSGALHARPNQYIWRRRIQQWGPRLDKPYAFYDWVERARRELAERGVRPVPIRVPLSGSEVAGASRAVPRAATSAPPSPDPESRVTKDAGDLVRLEVTVALHTGSAGPKVRTPSGASRVHVSLNPRGGAHWSPDADPPLVWLDLPTGVTAEGPLIAFSPLGDEADGALHQPLRVDFELSTPPVPLVPPKGDDGPPPSELVIPAYALYSVCLADGTCVFRRQDLQIRIILPAPPGPPPGDEEHDDDDR